MASWRGSVEDCVEGLPKSGGQEFREETAMSAMRERGWWATGLVTDLGTGLLLGFYGQPEGAALRDLRRQLEEGALLLREWASREGRIPREDNGDALWVSVCADVVSHLWAPDPGSAPPVAGNPGGALEEAAAHLAAGPGALNPREPAAARRLASLLTTLTALGWWCWSQECGPGGLQWRSPGDGRPSWHQLSCGLLACAADLARSEATLRSRVRPARHPLSRIVVHLREQQERVQAVIEGTADLLRFLASGLAGAPGGETGVPAAFLERVALELAWQRLTWARSLMASLHQRLVYLPAGEVEPVVYTVWEDVLAGLNPDTRVTLTAVPADTALRGMGLMDGGGGGQAGLGLVHTSLLRDDATGGGDDSGGIIAMAVQDLGNPLVWPLMARSGSLAHPRPPVLQAALAKAGEAFAASLAADPESEREAVSILADLVGLTAFGPSYLLAMATGVGARWPLLGGDGLPQRLHAMERELERRGLGDASVVRWVRAMAALRPPFVASSSAALKGEDDWEPLSDALRTCLQPGGLQPYGPAQVRMAARLVEGLADGQLISSVRRGASAWGPEALVPGPAPHDGRENGSPGAIGNHSPQAGASGPGGGNGGQERRLPQAVGRLYQQLRQVQDIPAGSAEILHAGWLFVTGPLTRRVQDHWLKGGSSTSWSWSDVARQLAGVDAILLRSLDVAAVHRLYAQEVARFDLE